MMLSDVSICTVVGINQGIEIYEDNIEFAIEKLKEFKEISPWSVGVVITSYYYTLFPSPISFILLSSLLSSPLTLI